jgi:hypothetical protein
MASPIDHCATTANSSSAGFIMVCDVQEFRPSTLVGTQEFKDPQQMDKACDNPVTQIKRQGDARFISKSGNMEAEGTPHREDFTTFLAGTNSTLNETWGNIGLYSSLQDKRRLVVLVSLSGHPLTLVIQFFSPQHFWIFPRLTLNSSLFSSPSIRHTQTIIQRAQLFLSFSSQCFGTPPHLVLTLLSHHALFRLCFAQSLFQSFLWTLDSLDPPLHLPLHNFLILPSRGFCGL